MFNFVLKTKEVVVAEIEAKLLTCAYTDSFGYKSVSYADIKQIMKYAKEELERCNRMSYED
jgi:hypothetical protein